MRSKLLFSFLLLASLAEAALAIDFSSNQVIIPVAGRFPGALNSIWRTDVTIANPSATATIEVNMSFETTGEKPQVVTFSLTPLQTTTTIDVVKSVFVRDNATGMMRVWTTSATDKVYARARVYNVGNAAGEFGQNVPAYPLEELSTDSFLPELTSANGNRTNAGITNPSSSKITVEMRWYDNQGVYQAISVLTVPAHSILLVSDVFAYTGMPRDKPFSIEFRSTTPIYGWASIVRNDTGDAVFVPGTTMLGF